MSIRQRAALPALLSFVLAGCAGVPLTQPLAPEVAPTLQPVDVKVGIRQPELIAQFDVSRAGQAAAAACGAVPGMGILLAAACGGVAGAADASINAARAKTADETVQPLKDLLVDVKFDDAMGNSLTQSLKGVPGMQLAGVAVTKTVDSKAYEETFRASTANAVMFVNVEYHLTADFSTLEVSARGLIYPRGAKARAAVNQPATLAAGEDQLALKNSAYRMNVIYDAKLAVPGAAPADYIAGWKSDGLIRSKLQDGIAQVSRLLAEDLARGPSAPKAVAAKKVDAGNGVMADLVAEGTEGRTMRFPDGSLHLLSNATITVAAATPAATAAPTATPAAAPATGTAPAAEPKAAQPTPAATPAAIPAATPAAQ